MAKIFVSYSHEDRDFVGRLVERVKQSGHEVLIDEKFLSLGDPITPEILRNIHEADFVTVFLSSHSVESKWVAQEIHETLFMELETRKTRLVPCLIEECNFPESLTKLKTHQRLYADFIHNHEEATRRLIKRLDQGTHPIFDGERYLVLNIPVPDLEIYLTGETWEWQRNPQLKYSEMLASYLLFGFVVEPWKYFKHFVLSAESDADRIRHQLSNAGYLVTGVGSKDPGTELRRIWFCLPNYPVEGRDQNNRWPESID